jgi:phytoene dehydrogenase-like protein
MSDVVIIGSGPNGLITAFYLAKAGLKPLVLERRDTIGGGAVTGEIHPGFRGPTLTHATGPLWHDVVEDMELARHGVRFLLPQTHVFAPGLDGRSLRLFDDPRRTADSIGAFSTKDADAYPAYRESMANVASALTALFTSVPPDIDNPGAGDLWNLLRTGRKFRGLGKRDGQRLLRWVPMAVADLVHEWFETELLAATIAAPGVSGTMLGPWSAGSALVLLLRAANQIVAQGTSPFVGGGPGALTQAMAAAAKAAGAEIRTGAAVERILITSERAAGVVLAGGEQMPARAIVSSADPKTTFLRLVDPTDLTPEFVAKIRNYRSTGTVVKVNLALSGLPRFAALGKDSSRHEEALSGRIHIGPDVDYLEHAFDHAKYGEYSSEPWLDITIPSILDPQLAPSGGHVMSIYAHYAPYQLRGTTWDAARESFGNIVLQTLARYAPGIEKLVVAGDIITPVELERRFGLFGGHIFHGELALDQLFAMRPVLGYGRYRTPIDGLYLCGAGTHPGGFLTGINGKLAAGEIVRDLK